MQNKTINHLFGNNFGYSKFDLRQHLKSAPKLILLFCFIIELNNKTKIMHEIFRIELKVGDECKVTISNVNDVFTYGE